jgi:hypothetical protein
MSRRQSRPPRNRKSRHPEPTPSEVHLIVPPSSAATADESGAKTAMNTESDELAAIDADWEQVLTGNF